MLNGAGYLARALVCHADALDFFFRQQNLLKRTRIQRIGALTFLQIIWVVGDVGALAVYRIDHPSNGFFGAAKIRHIVIPVFPATHCSVALMLLALTALPAMMRL